MNKKIVQLIHSELDIKHKKSLNKTKCKNEKEFSNDIRQIKKENCTLNITWELLRISNIQFTATTILPLPKRKTWDCFLQRMVFTQSIIKHYLEILGPKYTELTTIRSKSLKPHQVFFSIWVFFHEHWRIIGLQGKREGISLTPHYHFYPLHRHLGVSRAIAAESSLLHIASSRTRNENLYIIKFN